MTGFALSCIIIVGLGRRGPSGNRHHRLVCSGSFNHVTCVATRSGPSLGASSN